VKNYLKQFPGFTRSNSSWINSALSDLDENLLVQKYKFSHDRVQQAAYTLIDELRKQTVHLQIGRNLLEKLR